MTQSKSTPVQGLTVEPLSADELVARMTPPMPLADVSALLLDEVNRLRAKRVKGRGSRVELVAEVAAGHAISTLTRMEAEVGRLREALERVCDCHDWLAEQLASSPPGTAEGIRRADKALTASVKVARAALNPQEPTHAD